MRNTQKQNRPPVPKFDLHLQPDLSSPLTISTPIKSKSNKKFSKIFGELTSQMNNLPSQLQCGEVEKKALIFLQAAVLDKLKSRKYKFIAEVALTHAVGSCFGGKEFRQYLVGSDKKIIQILQQLHQQKLINASYLVHSRLGELNTRLGLNENFNQVCDQIKYILADLGFYDPFENANLSVATIQKIAGDIVFMQKGGVRLQSILQHCACSSSQLMDKLNTIKPYSLAIFGRMVLIYEGQVSI